MCSPEEVVAIVEISDSSLRKDTGPKRDLYARSGIVDYLVADVTNRLLLHYVHPSKGEYAEPQRLSYGNSFTLVGLSDIELKADPFLPPRD